MAYKVIIDSVYTRIEPRLPPEINIQLGKDLKYRQKGYQHTWLFKNKRWDGYVHLYDQESQCFRTGLLKRVK